MMAKSGVCCVFGTMSPSRHLAMGSYRETPHGPRRGKFCIVRWPKTTQGNFPKVVRITTTSK